MPDVAVTETIDHRVRAPAANIQLNAVNEWLQENRPPAENDHIHRFGEHIARGRSHAVHECRKVWIGWRLPRRTVVRSPRTERLLDLRRTSQLDEQQETDTAASKQHDSRPRQRKKLSDSARRENRGRRGELNPVVVIG